MFIARALSLAGVPCGHESLFTGRSADPIPDGTQGDASWLAAPFLSRLPKDFMIFHQTRDPIKVILSYVAEGFFRNLSYERPFWKHIAKRIAGIPPSGQYRLICLVRSTLPLVFAEDTELKRAARFWIEWNQLVRATALESDLDYLHYQVESIDQQLLGELISRIGVDAREVRDSLGAVPKDLNMRPRRESFAMDELGDCRDDLIISALSYGYILE